MNWWPIYAKKQPQKRKKTAKKAKKSGKKGEKREKAKSFHFILKKCIFLRSKLQKVR